MQHDDKEATDKKQRLPANAEAGLGLAVLSDSASRGKRMRQWVGAQKLEMRMVRLVRRRMEDGRAGLTRDVIVGPENSVA